MASYHLEIYISLFQLATVVSKKFDEISLKQLLQVETRIRIFQDICVCICFLHHVKQELSLIVNLSSPV